MPFGMYKDLKISQVPDSGLQYAIDNWKDGAGKDVADLCRVELDRRKASGMTQASEENLEEKADQLLKNAGFGNLCRKPSRRWKA
jgi:hypothetical protein